MPLIEYSVIVPLLDEAESVCELHREIVAALLQLGGEWEILYVDDGSQDATENLLEEIAEADGRVRVLSFTRNFGKSAAYMMGFHNARGRTVMTLDGDLQDDPREMGRLLRKLEEGFDLTIGRKMGRGRNELSKTIPSRLYNQLKAALFGIRLHDSNSGFRVMTRDVAASLNLYGDRYRFIPELAHLQGFRVAEAAVRHRKRKYGSSKYGPLRFFTGFLDLVSVRFLVGYGAKPLHFFGFVAMVPMTAGLLLELYVLYQKLMGSEFRTHMAALVVGVMLLIIAFLFLGTGLVCEMIAATRPPVHPPLRRRIGFD